MKTTQNEKILAHLREYGSINPLEAKELYRCMRLASRIGDLKLKGYNIISERGKGKNADGEPVRFAVYRLIPGTIGERLIPVQE